MNTREATQTTRIRALIEESKPLLDDLLAGKTFTISATPTNPREVFKILHTSGGTDYIRVDNSLVKLADDHVRIDRARVKVVNYQNENGGTETRTVVGGSKGVTVLPILEFEGEKFAVLIFAPFPAVGKWGLVCPAGVVDKAYTPRATAVKETAEEAGMIINNLRLIIDNIAAAPNRYAAQDKVYLADAVEYIGKQTTEKEERDIKSVLVPVSMLPELLDRNVIYQAVSRAAIEAYLRKHVPLELSREIRG